MCTSPANLIFVCQFARFNRIMWSVELSLNHVNDMAMSGVFHLIFKFLVCPLRILPRMAGKQVHM